MPEQLQLQLYFPPTIVQTNRPDGAVLVIPGKPVPNDKMLTIREVAQRTGYKERHVRRLARSLNATQRGHRCKLLIPASEVARLLSLKAR